MSVNHTPGPEPVNASVPLLVVAAVLTPAVGVAVELPLDEALVATAAVVVVVEVDGVGAGTKAILTDAWSVFPVPNLMKQ